MYPLLRTDDRRAERIDAVAADIASLAEHSSGELELANRENRFPREVYQELGRRGYLGPLVPQEWGGSGGGVAEYVVINEEVGRHGMVSGQVAVQGQRWLLDWGTDEQKERWLRAIATGTAVFSESISEKQAGSSFKTMAATATRDGSDWILDGSKTHVNMGADCDVTLFYAIAPEGLTSFLVDTSLPGISTRVTDAIGSRLIRTADVHFDGVRVRDADLLGPVGVEGEQDQTQDDDEADRPDDDRVALSEGGAHRGPQGVVRRGSAAEETENVAGISCEPLVARILQDPTGDVVAQDLRRPARDLEHLDVVVDVGVGLVEVEAVPAGEAVRRLRRALRCDDRELLGRGGVQRDVLAAVVGDRCEVPSQRRRLQRRPGVRDHPLDALEVRDHAVADLSLLRVAQPELHRPPAVADQL
jgi:hypothetical protein